MKYIMLEQTFGVGKNATKRKVPIIFPEVLTHALVAEMLVKSPELKDAKPISAGFCKVRVDSTHGESVSLNVKSKPDDDFVINTHDYLGGLM